MDSKTKAVAARISLEDYKKIRLDTARLGIKISEWLICKMYGYPLINSTASSLKGVVNEQALSFPDQKSEQIQRLQEEINRLEKRNKGFIKRIHQVESENSARSARIEKLEYLLGKYDKNWLKEYDNFYGY